MIDVLTGSRGSVAAEELPIYVSTLPPVRTVEIVDVTLIELLLLDVRDGIWFAAKVIL